MKKGCGKYTFFIITFSVFFLDQLTKYFVDQLRPNTGLTSFFKIQYATNTGISFGLLQAYPLVPILISIGVIGGIVYYYKELVNDKMSETSFALILGGAIGNLTDRMLYGHVIDFINFSFWPNFNIADSAITIGAILIIVKMIKEK